MSSKAAPKKRKAANGYKFAKPLPLGEVLKDILKKEWKLGRSIGQGGFGEIYEAKEASATGNKYPYVIKIEPHDNGPLFVEMHFYMRNAKPEDVNNFKKKKGLKTFGMPLYLGSGSHEFEGEKYRFIVMEKFGTDLWKTFLEHNKIFPATTVFKIAVQMLDVLEYIHSNGYVHADLKGANILMGITKETQNKQLYLVDFGLATKWSDNEVFKPDPKKAHNGTIEYLSRDAHLGVSTRRGDLEILVYNIIQWLGCVLPWEKNLTNPKIVQKSKEEYMSDIPKFLRTCFIQTTAPAPVADFLKYLVKLEHNTCPDYNRIRKMFISGIDSSDGLDKPFKFSVDKSSTKRKSEDAVSTPKIKKTATNKKINNEKENLDEEDDNQDINTDEMPSLRNGRNRRNLTEVKVPKKKTQSPAKNDSIDDLNGYTDAMKEILKRKKERETLKNKKKKEVTKDDDMDGYNDGMKEVVLKKKAKVTKKTK